MFGIIDKTAYLANKVPSAIKPASLSAAECDTDKNTRNAAEGFFNNNNNSFGELARMQPTATASVPNAGEMDLQTMQSMDWLFKKERIYLLAQFWQQRATLAEKENASLKEQLTSNKTAENDCKDSIMDKENNSSKSNFEDKVAAKDKEIVQLIEQVQRLQSTISTIKESSRAQIQRLEEQLEHNRQHINRLENRLDAQRDYEDLKQEVGQLRSFELSTTTQNEPTKVLNSTPHTPTITPKPLDLLIADRSQLKSSSSTSSEHAQRPASRVESPGNDRPASQPATCDTPELQIVQNGANNASSPTSHSNGPTPLLPPPLQNVEQFGSFLGEEIVANWRRSLERGLNNPSLHMPHNLQSPPPQCNSTDSSLRPVSTTPVQNDLDKSTASTPIPTDTTHRGESPSSIKTNEDNNNLHNNIHHNNNSHMGLNSNLGLNPLMCNFLRGDDNLKSPPFPRFGDPSDPPQRTFRFADDLGGLTGAAMRLGESLIPKGDPMEARLQEMLRYNMDKYATQNLDTLHIARRVRELLSIHNIGQRLFAKYVLGLSQGTVSELLSKPKPWDKLTEKGRDSYRKMHAWACDENAVMLLKSLIPKKGKDTGLPPFGRNENEVPDERIVHMLNEANQHLMKAEDSRDNDDSKSPSQRNCTSPYSKESSQSKKFKKYENDDIPQEKVLRIYQEELAKLMGRRMEDIRNPREPFPGGGALPMDRNQEDMRMALEAYHRELAKLNPGVPPSLAMPGIPSLLALQQQALQQHALNGAQDLSLPKEKSCNNNNNNNEKMMNGVPENEPKDDSDRHSSSAFSLVRPKLEPGVNQSNTNSAAPSPLGNNILPPTEDFTGVAVASPLQRMASITNSLISQPPPQSHHTPSQRPLKAVLPPITQQQFDMFNNLNTEDIVKRVKEQLSQYSISQRLFGESVLGLSQGSVSDLLARPKPWHMLTQKGREPFIRMKMFLEDDNAVHKLVASQYKIAPEKLMRTGGYGGSGNPIQANKPMTPTSQKIMSEAAGLLNKMKQENHQAFMPPSLQQLSQNPHNQTPQPPHMLLNSPIMNQMTPQMHQAMNSSMNHNSMPTPEQMIKKSQSPHRSPSVGSGNGMPMATPPGMPTNMRAFNQHISPSVYEMAALTQDLDTQVITTKIKEALLANNIGQKIFGEAVLGLSQGSVSELLSKPKPWHMLSIKGREPFIRMQLWLSDVNNIDRLQALKNERREANKRRRSTGAGGGHDNSSDTSSNDTSEFYHPNSPGPGPPSTKKQRVLFSEEQKEALRLAFQLDPYPNIATIEFLAAELGLSSRTITNWFHNHRMRLKQQSPHGGIPNDVPARDQAGNQPPFDPVQFRLLLNQRLLELQKERIGLGTVPLPYNPYFAANANLAALINRGLLPSGEMDLSALNNAMKEQMSGLDLSMQSMSSLKHETSNGDFDDDDMSNVGSEDSNMSAPSPKPTEEEPKLGGASEEMPTLSRSSRRKPAAPQWVNPDWQGDKAGAKPNEDEVIINGVCVMQSEPGYGRLNSEETVRVDPTPVLDRFDDDRSDATSLSEANDNQTHAVEERPDSERERTEDDESRNCKEVVKNENEEERWEY